MSEVKVITEIVKSVNEAAETKSILLNKLDSNKVKLASDITSSINYGDVKTRYIKDNEVGKKKLAEIKSWIKEVNPKYEPFTPYGQNCGTCALVVHNRMRGDSELVAGRINIAPRDSDMEELTKLKCKYMSPEAIENILKSRGEGSELIVGINRRSGAGHWFNAFYDGEHIYTVDGQSGKVMDWPHDYGDISQWCALI